MKDKLAEEIIKHRLGIKDLSNSPYYPTFYKMVIDLMQAYHEAKMKEVTDADIRAWASENVNEETIWAAMYGAKTMRNGEIKHIEK